jgi:hypothetical protein
MISDRAKSDIYREFLGPLNSGKVALLDHPQITTELLNLERRVARGGQDTIDHPRGMHDDYINAAAGVLTLLTGVEVDSWAMLALRRSGKRRRRGQPRRRVGKRSSRRRRR